MKLPSLNSLYKSVIAILKRFPIQFLLALAATVIFCCLVNNHIQEHKDDLWKLLAICNLALTLLLALDLFAESHQYSNVKQWAFRLLGLGFCTLLYFSLNPKDHLADIYRIGLFAFAFHLFVAFSPFIGKKHLNGFWQYNKSLFLRFLTAALYSSVLYAGLAVALAAIDGLFNVHIDGNVYMQMFGFIGIGFNTIFFLAGIPVNFIALEEDMSYPKGLKIFTQYVLIPLMTIYLAILLVYEIKIGLAWQLPKGLVSTLILGYAVFGILSLLLVYPIKETEGHGWIKLFSRFFYIMMIPLVGLLLLAIWKRVGSYGITESRYLLVVLALWLTGITSYFLISQKQNIKVIPISLCIVALLAIYGPQSAFSVSKYSQLIRLKKIINSKGKQQAKEKGAVIRYLVRQHGLASLQSFTKTDLDLIEQSIESKSKNKYLLGDDKVDTAFAILKVDKGEMDESDRSVYFNINNNNDGMIQLDGYNYLMPLDGYANTIEKSLGGKKLIIKRMSNYVLSVEINGANSLAFDVRKIAEEANALRKQGKLESKFDSNYKYPESKMTLIQSNNLYEVKLVLSNLNFDTSDDEIKGNIVFGGYLLFKKK